MIIAKYSNLSGRLNEMDIPVTHTELRDWMEGDELIQDAFPHLTPEQREFLKTGITPAEWDAVFPYGDDEPEDVHFEEETWGDEPF